MLFPRRFAVPLLFLVIVGLTGAIGCGKQSAPSPAAGSTAERLAAQPEKANPEKTAMTKQVTVAVTGMTWPNGWPPRVQKALASLPWVRQVQVDFPKKQAVVTVETEKYDEKGLVKALEKAGSSAR
jgi:hypothetical protein